MTSQLVLCRNMVLAAIKAAQQNGVWNDLAQAIIPLTLRNFVAASSYIPLSKLTDQVTKEGRIWVIGTSVDDLDRMTRRDPTGTVRPLVTRELKVQVGYQQSNVLADNITQLDAICSLLEQLRDAVKNFDYVQSATPEFQPLWCRNETLKDENGVPFYFYMLREGNVVESYFTACFTLPHQ